ncbi:MAG TPA: SLBB domain-containing protein, partial [Arenibaculum sp.]|nr:SLBB domain-containing protein [Arenibaculum sp.]
VAVAGDVGRAAIYELPDGDDAIDAAEAIELAAGRRHRGEADLLRLTSAKTGNETAVRIGPADTTPLADGDIVLVRPLRSGRLGTVALTGHVRNPGPRALASTPTAAGLIATTELPPGTYLPFAAIERTDPETLARVLIAIDLEAVVEGRGEVRLEAGDGLIVLGSGDIGFLTSAPVLALLSGRHPPAVPDCAGLSVLTRRIRAEPDGPLAAGPLARAAAALVPAPVPCPSVFDRHPDLLSFALDHGVLVRDGVARPGIYPAAGRVSIDRLERVAGRAADRAAGPGEDGGSLAVMHAGPENAAYDAWAKRGDVVEARPRTYAIEGHVRHPGLRPLAPGATLRAVIAARDLAEDAYPLAAILERYDLDRLARTHIVFSPAEVLGGGMDLLLERGDRIRILSMDEVRQFGNPESGSPESGDAGIGGETGFPGAPGDDGRAVLAERAVEIRGAVRHPGWYPVAGAATLDALLAASGGLTRDAEAGAIEIVDPRPGRAGPDAGRRTADLALPGAGRMEIRHPEVIRVHRRAGSGPPQRATVTGEVKRPGSYEFASGETLSSLLRRAGGFTAAAYPAGAVFTRESARLREADAFTRAAAELDRKTALLLLGDEPPPEEHVRAVRALASNLRTAHAVGRITVEADMAALAVRPDLDIMLENGDLIMIPRRPLTVAVSGEVLAPASLQFSAGKAAADYIRDAGGTTRNADEGRAFVILPDGRSQPVGISFWNHRPVFIPPGATIVVPRDPAPLDLLEMTESVGSIIGQMATAAASLAILGRQ